MMSAWFSAKAADAVSASTTATRYFIFYPPAQYSRARRPLRQGGRLRRSLVRHFTSGERLDPGLCPAEDQRVDVVRALIGVHDFQVDEVADDAELVRDAVS